MKMEEYQAGVVKPVGLARTSTSGGRAAAKVVLSAYNGSEWQLNVADLCLLDSTHYQAALAVIRGRVELNAEPHDLIKDGDQVFSDLWDKWDRFQLGNRHKALCHECYGSGKKCNDNGNVVGTCPRCDGSGLEEEGICKQINRRTPKAARPKGFMNCKKQIFWYQRPFSMPMQNSQPQPQFLYATEYTKSGGRA